MGQKINGSDFEISGSDFKIQGTNFRFSAGYFFAPRNRLALCTLQRPFFRHANECLCGRRCIFFHSRKVARERHLFLKYFPTTGRPESGKSWYTRWPTNAASSTVFTAMRASLGMVCGSNIITAVNSAARAT